MRRYLNVSAGAVRRLRKPIPAFPPHQRHAGRKAGRFPSAALPGSLSSMAGRNRAAEVSLRADEILLKVLDASLRQVIQAEGLYHREGAAAGRRRGRAGALGVTDSSPRMQGHPDET